MASAQGYHLLQWFKQVGDPWASPRGYASDTEPRAAAPTRLFECHMVDTLPERALILAVDVRTSQPDILQRPIIQPGEAEALGMMAQPGGDQGPEVAQRAAGVGRVGAVEGQQLSLHRIRSVCDAANVRVAG